MRKGILILLALITLVYYAEKANAAFLLEPYVGAQVSSTYDVDGGTEGDLTGSAVGVKAGFTNMGFSVGVDGQRASLTLEPETGDDSDYTFTRLGMFVGYDIPLGLRLWGEYVFSYEGVNGDDTDVKLNEGSGTVIGIGYKVIPFVSLNLEVSNLATAQVVSATTESDQNISYTSYLLSISLPFSI